MGPIGRLNKCDHGTQKEEVYISTKGQEHSKVIPFEQKNQSAK
jgi:hypothetical protein